MKFRLARHTGRAAFATRQAAIEVRTEVSTSLSTLKPGDDLEIDLSGVESMTISYADELFAKLAAERRAFADMDTFYLLSNASPEIAETISVALERRSLVTVHRNRKGEVELLAAGPQLEDTLEAALELREFTARELADELDISLPAANNRIRVLAEAGAVVRSRHAPAHGGRQYLYQIAA